MIGQLGRELASRAMATMGAQAKRLCTVALAKHVLPRLAIGFGTSFTGKEMFAGAGTVTGKGMVDVAGAGAGAGVGAGLVGDDATTAPDVATLTALAGEGVDSLVGFGVFAGLLFTKEAQLFAGVAISNYRIRADDNADTILLHNQH